MIGLIVLSTIVSLLIITTLHTTYEYLKNSLTRPKTKGRCTRETNENLVETNMSVQDNGSNDELDDFLKSLKLENLEKCEPTDVSVNNENKENNETSNVFSNYS